MNQIPPVEVDLVVVGAGVVGLGAALAASKAGKRVAVVERNWRQTGASVRNFGHVGVTLQEGKKREYAIRSTELWRETGITMREEGAVLVARGEDELALIEERGLRVLSRDETLERVPIRDERVQGGAFLIEDAQIDPRTAVMELTSHLERRGVSVWTGTNVTHIEEGLVHTNRGPILAEHTLVAVNNEVERFFPEIAREHGMMHCMLDMIALQGPRLDVPLLTASSLLRYSSHESEAANTVRERLYEEGPALRMFDINEMYTMRSDGMLLVGDTHRKADTVEPFQDGAAFEALERLAATMFGVHRPRILQRWQGVYAEAVRAGKITEIPGAEATIRDFKASGHRVAFTTGFARVTQGLILESLGWQNLADLALVPADAGRGRPSPDLNLTALIRLGGESVQHLVSVGDTPSDMLSGARAGAGRVVGVLTGGTPAHSLEEAGATNVLGSVAEFGTLLV